MSTKRQFKPRLPEWVVQKLASNNGGGTHKKEKGKGSYVRKEKHRGQSLREEN